MNRGKQLILAVTAAALLMVTPVIAAEPNVNQQGIQNNQHTLPMQNVGPPAAVGDQQSQQVGQNRGPQFNPDQGQSDPKQVPAQSFQGNQGPASDQRMQGNQGFQQQQQGDKFVAQNVQPGQQGQPGPGGPGLQGQQGQQGTAFGVVIAVDKPDNCLRLRQSPSSQSSLLGCAQMNEKLPLTGQWSQDGKWLQTTKNAWVYAPQVKTDLKRPPQARHVTSRRSSDSFQEEDEEYLEAPEIWSTSDTADRGYTDTGIVYGPGADRLYGRYGAHRGYTDTGVVYGPGADMLYGGYGRRPGFGVGIRIR
jgi:hypothetical protein